MEVIITKAQVFFVLGCLIFVAGVGQMISAISEGRYLAAVHGAACVIVAVGCCRTNWKKIWHRQL